MSQVSKPSYLALRQLIPLIAVLLAACASPYVQQNLSIALSGAQEVPPVTTSAAGTGQLTVEPDHTVSGSIATTGITATAAHIHEGAPGSNGPVIIPLTKTSDNGFAVPAGAKLSDSQYASYRAGKLYVNVHSAAHPGGEIRAQITPASAAAPAKQSGY